MTDFCKPGSFCEFGKYILMENNMLFFVRTKSQ